MLTYESIPLFKGLIKMNMDNPPRFGAPPPQNQQVPVGSGAFYPNAMYDQGGNRMQIAQPIQQQHSPLGSLAAFKGHCLIDFFIKLYW